MATAECKIPVFSKGTILVITTALCLVFIVSGYFVHQYVITAENIYRFIPLLSNGDIIAFINLVLFVSVGVVLGTMLFKFFAVQLRLKINDLNIEKEKQLSSQLDIFAALYSSEENRKIKLSKEINREISTKLSVAYMHLSNLQQQVSDSQTADNFKIAMQLLDEAVDTAGIISFEMNPHHVEMFGIKKSVELYLKLFEKKFGYFPEFESNVSRLSNINTEVYFYKIFSSLLAGLCDPEKKKFFKICLHSSDESIVTLVESGENKLFYESTVRDLKQRVEIMNGTFSYDTQLGTLLKAEFKQSEISNKVMILPYAN